VRELRLVAETVDLTAILGIVGDGRERDNIVEMEAQCRVNVVNN
jgi:hypothetical protein